jgi:UPF0755 protein
VDHSIDEEDDHLLFGSTEHDGRVDDQHHDPHHDSPSAPRGSRPAATGHVAGATRRTDRPRPSSGKRHGRRRLARIIAVLALFAIIAVSWVIVKQVSGSFGVADYSGAGEGIVRITVSPGDSADAIGATLQKAGVVKSARAFANAASKSGQAGDIQPGVYQVRLHSSGAAAVAAILDPANQLVSKVTIPEGFTYKQVLQAISTKTGLSLAALNKALANTANLGIPDGLPTKSAEGMLFPATYSFDPNTTADSALQTIVTQFGTEFTTLQMAAKSKALGETPYNALIIASITEAEAKFDSDRAKVARVIMNRLAKPQRLQVDATSAYAAKLLGLDPTKVTYATLKSAFNSYTHDGLPPTPIGNPGEAAINAALNPPAGDWLFYVNIDAAGHLGFFDNEADFLAAQNHCAAEGWGCAPA